MESKALDANDLGKLEGLPAAEHKVGYKLEFDTNHELRLKHLAEKLCRRGRYAGPLFDPQLLHTPPEHQREAVAGAAQPWVEGYLLLDDSGLGKTIEAGMILSRELRRRRIYASTSSSELRQALVVAPRSLHKHWSEELWAKFGLYTQVVTSDPRDGSELSSWRGSRSQVVITSPGTARAHWEDIQGFDVVLFDECQLYDEDTMAALGAIRSAARICLVASSTPVRSDISDVLSLLGLAAPSERWDSYTALDASAAHDTLGAELRAVASRAYRNILMSNGKLFPRRMESRDYEIDDVEADAYAEVRKMRADYMRRGGHDTAWAFVALEQTLLSSAQVFHALLCRLMGEAEQGGEQYLSADQHDDSFEFLRDSSYFQRRLRAVRESLGSRTLPSASLAVKEACMLDVLAECRGERLLVFTRYRATQERLATLLAKARFSGPVEIIDERSSLRERLGIVNRFAERTLEKRGDGPNGVLIVTDRAVVGLDLQTSFRSLLNYDLPWDPLRLERRIGRLQRWGQRDEVRVFNLVAKTPDTHERSMDERVLEVCNEPFAMHHPTEPCNDALYALHPTQVVRHLAGDGTDLKVIPPPNQVALAELDELLLGDRSAAHQLAVAQALEHDATFREMIAKFWSIVSYGGSSLQGARGYLFGRLRLALLQGQIGVLCAPGRKIEECRKWSLAVGIRLMFEGAMLDPGREPLDEDWLLEDEEVYLWAVDHDRKLLDWSKWLTEGGLDEVPRDKAAEFVGEEVITFMQARKQEIESRGLDAVPFDTWQQGAPPQVADKLEVVSEHAAKMAKQRMKQIRGDWDYTKSTKAELLKRRLELARSAEASEEVVRGIQARQMQLTQRRVELRQQVLGTQIFVILH
jgi:superfamily II DNA or RNA helicase